MKVKYLEDQVLITEQIKKPVPLQKKFFQVPREKLFELLFEKKVNYRVVLNEYGQLDIIWNK